MLMNDLKLTDVLDCVREHENSNYEFEVVILSNAVVHPFAELLQFFFIRHGINVKVHVGNFDNIIEDAKSYSHCKFCFVFWELSYISSMNYSSNHPDLNQKKDSIYKKIKTDIDFFRRQLGTFPFLVFNSFSSMLTSSYNYTTTIDDQLASLLNHHLSKISNDKLFLVNIDKIIATLGVEYAFDRRMSRIAKAPYSFKFLIQYINMISPHILDNTKKVLVVDCDNTLWKGIIGEDGAEGVVVFYEIQKMLRQLHDTGILLCISSKNNKNDVDEVFDLKSDMPLNKTHFVIEKISWKEKYKEIKSIAQELNLGLDSFVFLDDSDFEVNQVRELLPEVSVFQVPKSMDEYIILMQKIINLFSRQSNTVEDSKRTELYKMELSDKLALESSENINDYFKSLSLHLVISIDEVKHVNRVVQLTQKTNQFNLTTKRYTIDTIQSLVQNPNCLVISARVEDKFGDKGITALAILKLEDYVAIIDTFLLSCRVLGRRIELQFFQEIVNLLKKKGIKKLESNYIKTIKNNQVSQFWSSLGFTEEEYLNNGDVKYSIPIGDVRIPTDVSFIGVDYGRKVKNGTVEGS